jgi:DNA-directed RNA polymerase sigma subunit (sigma70/sigma32)
MTFLWPNEDGWPYPDPGREEIDLDSNVDDDMMLFRAAPMRLFAPLNPLERQVLTAHYGLGGSPARSMKELHNDLGLPRAEIKEVLAGGLAKLRTNLAE